MIQTNMFFPWKHPLFTDIKHVLSCINTKETLLFFSFPFIDYCFPTWAYSILFPLALSLVTIYASFSNMVMGGLVSQNGEHALADYIHLFSSRAQVCHPSHQLHFNKVRKRRRWEEEWEENRQGGGWLEGGERIMSKEKERKGIVVDDDDGDGMIADPAFSY